MPTFDDYISNPMGGKSAVFTQREMYRAMYTKKLDIILLRENGKIDYHLYTAIDGRYIAHIKVPSEVVPKFYYDVVIEFSPINGLAMTNPSLNKGYNAKFYSNDPAFVYTFAHAFLTNDLFIRDLVPRMSKQAVKKVAKEKNPHNNIGYVKSIYFAYLIMKTSGLFNKTKFKSEAIRYSKRSLLSSVEHADKKIADRQEQGNALNKSKRAAKIHEKNKQNTDVKEPSSSIKSKTVPTIKTTKTTPTIGSKVKTSKSIKRI